MSEKIKQNLESEKINPQIKLSETQKKEFEEFIKQKEIEETKKYSEQERQKLLSEFLESKKYTQRSSEILAGTKLEKNFGNKENFEKFTKTIDSGVFEYFFGNSGELKGLNIAEEQKKSFSAGVSIFLINKFYNEVEKTGNLDKINKELEKFLGGDGDIMKLGENLTNPDFDSSKIIDLIKNIFTGDIASIIGNIYDKNKFDLISKSINNSVLKNNLIFTNPNETFNFFKQVSENNFGEEKIKNLILSKNSENLIIGGDFSELQKIGDKIGNFITPEIGKLLGTTNDIKNFFSSKIEQIGGTISGNKEISGFFELLFKIPIIGNLLKGFLDFFNIDLESLGKENENFLKSIKEKITGKNSFLKDFKLSENFGKNEKGELNSIFISNMIFISGNNKNSLDENLENILKKGSDFEKFIKDERLTKLPGLETNLKNSNGELIFKNFNNLVSIYKEYLIETKNNGEIKNLENFIKAKSENKINSFDLENLEEKNIPQEKNDYIVKGVEKFGYEYNEKNGNYIEYIFSLNGKKYQVNLTENGIIQLMGNGELNQFSGGKELFEALKNFDGKLDKEALASDFGKNISIINPSLGTNIKNILINGYKNEPGLKQIISEKFFSSGFLVKNNVSIRFSDKNYTFNFIGSKKAS